MNTLVGYVAGQWLTTNVETGSTALTPPKEGLLTFTPVLSHQVALNPVSSLPYGLISRPVSAALDSEGHLLGDSFRRLPLPVGTWHVQYDFGRGQTWPAHDITVTEEHTEDNPLWIPAVSPLPTAPRVVQIVTNEARLAAEMAAEMAEHNRDMADQFQRAAWQEAERAAEQVDLAADQVTLARDAVAGVQALNSLRVDTTVGTRVFFDHPGGTLMLTGDTGLRSLPVPTDVPGAIPAGPTPFTVRRVGNVVTANIDRITFTAGYGSGSLLILVPTGFRPHSAFLPSSGYPSGVARAWTWVEGGLIAYSGSASADARWEWTFITKDPWPTVLPGLPTT